MEILSTIFIDISPYLYYYSHTEKNILKIEKGNYRETYIRKALGPVKW